MPALPVWQTIPLFLIIIGFLIVVHELGHFITAKRFGVEAPEFAIGFPPRILTFWKTNGWIRMQGKKIVIPRKLDVPEQVQIGSWVTYKTTQDKGREVLTAIAPVDDESRGLVMASQVQGLDRGTIFTLNAVPFGGYVRMSGEEDPSAPNSLASKPAWQRAIVLVGGVTMNFILAYLIFIALPMWMPSPVFAGSTTVAQVLEGSPAAKAGLRVGDTITTVDGADVRDSREKMASALSNFCDKTVSLGVERLNPRSGVDNLNLQLAPRAGQGSDEPPCVLGIRVTQGIGAKIADVQANSLAAQIGLRPGDALVSVGDYAMLPPNSTSLLLRTEDDLSAYLREHYKVRSVVLVRYVRDSRIQEAKLTIPEGLSADQATLGLGLRMNVPQAIGEASVQMYSAITSVPRAFRDLFTNLTRGNNSGVVGPVGITQIVAEGTPNGGIPFLISLVGVLSLNLAIFNLLPFPGLDGGRLLFVLAEVITRGRKLDPRKEGLIHLAGFLVLIAFILVVSYFDVTRLLAGKSPFGP